MKGFEERLKKQDAKIQNFMEVMTVDGKTLEKKIESINLDLKSKMEANNAKMMSMMIAMSHQFNNWVKGLSHDKAIFGNPRSNPERFPELLGSRDKRR